MKRKLGSVFSLATVGAWAALASWAPQTCQAQYDFFPRAIYVTGATPYSADTHAEADFFRAVGEAQVNLAIAREHNENAYEHALDNEQRRINTIYSKKLLHRYYTSLLKPPAIVRQTEKKKKMLYRIQELPQEIRKVGVTYVLNWMLGELYGLPSASSESQGEGAELDQDHIQHIRLADRPGTDSDRLIFRAHDGKVLRTDWPRWLLSKSFTGARLDFEAARDRALAAGKKSGKLSASQQKQLLVAMRTLRREFGLHDPDTREQTQDWAIANRFLRQLESQVRRLVDTNDQRSFDGSLAFSGNTVGSLVEFMKRRGLAFADPESGDEGTYEYLFWTFRELAQDNWPDEPLPGVIPPPPGVTSPNDDSNL